MKVEERLDILEDKVYSLEEEVMQLKMQLKKSQNMMQAMMSARNVPNGGMPPGAMQNRGAVPPGAVPPPNAGMPPAGNMPPRQAPPTGNVPPRQVPPAGNVPPRQAPPAGNVPPRQVPPAGNVPPRQVPPAGNVPPRPVSPSVPPRPATPRNTNLEATIGKNVIGILASVLFFIAFIVFGTYIYQNLGNMGKSILLYTGSIIITVVGLGVHKKLENNFSLSLIGCGMGCFYICLIINTVYFGFLSKLGLYALVLVWLLGMSMLSKRYESMLLCIIGECGLYLSVFFGVASPDISDVLWFSFFVFFLVADIFYLRFCSVDKDSPLYLISTICSTICCVCIAFRNRSICLSYIEKGGANDATVFMYICIVLACLGYVFYHFHKEMKQSTNDCDILGSFFASVYFFIIMLIYGVMVYTIHGGITKASGLDFIMLFIFSVVAMIYLELYIEKKQWAEFDNMVYFLNVPCLLLQMVICMIQLDWHKYNLFILPIVVLLGYGFYRGKRLYQASAITLLLLHCLFAGEPTILHFVFTVGMFALAFVLQKKYTESYSGVTKVFLYLLWFMYFIRPAIDLNEFLSDFHLNATTLFVLLLTPFQVFALKSEFIKNYKDLSEKEEYMEILVRIGNIVLVCLGICCLHSSIPWEASLLLVLATSVLCFIGLKDIVMNSEKNSGIGFYVGIKSTLYFVAVFSSTPISNKILISVLLLSIALVAILIGFVIRMKSFRVYGLVLTMLSVVKLTLFDIDYSSTLGTVAALLVCGILCFIINFSYNMLSSKYITSEEENHQG